MQWYWGYMARTARRIWICLGLALLIGPQAMTSAAIPPVCGWTEVLVSMALPESGEVPIRRWRITDDQLTRLQATNEVGPLVRMSRTAFERKVQILNEKTFENQRPVRLMQAQYRARLVGENFVGQAQWSFENPRSQAALFLAEPLGIAVTEAKWTDGQPVIMGWFGRGFRDACGIWVAAGRRSMVFDWSAAGTMSQSECRFELPLPSAVSTTLELELPQDRLLLLVGAEGLLTGPFTSSLPGHRLWRCQWVSPVRLELIVKPTPSTTEADHPVRANLVARYSLEPWHIRCSFDYELESISGEANQWVFEVDPQIRVLDAMTTGRAGWQVEPAAAENAHRKLRVQLRQPASGGKVQITALAPLSISGVPGQPLPLIRPRYSRIGEERLHVRIAPDLHIAPWTDGDYRLLSVTTEADSSISLAFLGTLLPEGTNRANRLPPALSVVSTACDFESREQLDCRIESGRLLLEARLRIRVRRGLLTSLPVHLPTGYSLMRWASDPEDRISSVGPTSNVPTSTAIIDFQRPVKEGQEVILQFWLRGPSLPANLRADTPARLPLPRVTPLGAAERSGEIRLGSSPGFQGELLSASLSPLGGRLGYRGRDPEGLIQVFPQPTDWTLNSRTVLSRLDGQLVSQSRITVRIPTAPLSTLIFVIPEDASRDRRWEVIRAAETLATVNAIPLADLPLRLSQLSPLSAAWSALWTVPSIASGPWTAWRLTFSKPIQGDIELQTRVIESDGLAAVHVPLPTLLDCPTQSAVVELDSSLAQEFRHDIRSSWDTRLPVRMVIPRRTFSQDAEPGVFSALTQISQVDEIGRVSVLFGGQWNPTIAKELNITLAADSVPEFVFIDGQPLLLTATKLEKTSTGVSWQIPFPAKASSFVVRYSLPTTLSWGLGWVRSPLPLLFGKEYPCRRYWQLPPAMTPLIHWTDLPQSTEISQTLLVNYFQSPILQEFWGRSENLATLQTSSDHVLVILTPLLWGLRIAVACGLLAICWGIAFGRKRPSARTLVIAISTLTFIALINTLILTDHLRWLVLVLTMAAALLVVARGRRAYRHPLQPVAPVITSTPALVIGLTVTLSIPLAAQNLRSSPSVDLPKPLDVFVLPQEDVLVPQEVYDRLEVMARPFIPHNVITRAQYEGWVSDGLAHFKAQFTVVNLAEEPTSILLPLADVRMDRLELDGQPAYPSLTAPGTYSVLLSKSPQQTITARFSVPVKATGPDREVRFGIPNVPDCQLSWQRPPDSRELTVLGRKGRIQESQGLIQADLGAIRSVHLRWRERPETGGLATVQARLAGIWTVSESDAELLTTIALNVVKGSTAQFQIELPSEFDLTRVSLRSAESMQPVAIRKWTISPPRAGFRAILIELQAPLSGQATLILEAVPNSCLTTRPTLKFPRLIGISKLQNAFFGLRTEQVLLQDLSHPQMEQVTSDVLMQEFPQATEWQFLDKTTLRLFRASGSSSPEFRPRLAPLLRPIAVTQNVSWLMTPSRRADGQGSLRWVANDGQFSHLSWRLPPPVRLLELHGPDLQGWTVDATGLVRAWLKKPVQETTLEWFATMPGEGNPKATTHFSFAPPIPRFSSAEKVTTTVTVEPSEGYGQTIDRTEGWNSIPTVTRSYTYQSTSPQSAVPVWSFFPPRPSSPAAAGLGILHLDAQTVTYQVVRTIPTVKGRPGHYVLTVSDLPPSASLEPQFPPEVRVIPRGGTSNRQSWDIEELTATGLPLRVALTIRWPRPQAETPLPTVDLNVGGSLNQSPHPLSWIAFKDDSSSGWRLRGVAWQQRWDEALKLWPHELNTLQQRQASLGIPRGSRAALRLAPREETPTAPAAPADSSNSPATPHPTDPPSTALQADRHNQFPVHHLLQSLQPVSTRTLALICTACLLLSFLAWRFPRSTWPEQIGLLALFPLLAFSQPWGYALLISLAARLGHWFWRRIEPILLIP